MTSSCQPSSSPSSFDVQFKNELGESVTQNISSYVIRDGDTSKYIPRDAIDSLGEAVGEPFYVLSNAQIYIPAYREDENKRSSDF